MSEFEREALERLTRIETIVQEKANDFNKRLGDIEEVLNDGGRDGLVQRVQKLENSDTAEEKNHAAKLSWIALLIAAASAVASWWEK